MGKTSIRGVYVELSDEDISDRVEQAKLTLGKNSIDITALGDGWQDAADGNTKRWAATLGLFQDYSSSEAPVYSIVKALVIGSTTGGSSGKQFLIRPSSEAAGRSNPQLSGTVVLDSDLDFLNAVSGEANKFTITLKGCGAPTFTDTSS